MIDLSPLLIIGYAKPKPGRWQRKPFLQLTLGRGSDHRRVIWWHVIGIFSLRLYGLWRFGVSWRQRSMR